MKSQNAIAETGKWPRAATTRFTDAQAAPSVLAGAVAPSEAWLAAQMTVAIANDRVTLVGFMR